MNRAKSNVNLAEEWQSYSEESFSEQEKIDLVVRTGEEHAREFTEQVRALLDDESTLVKYYALQALVIDLKATGPDVETACWHYLENDPNEDIRAMAATCLGSLKAGSREASTFHRLVSTLNERESSAHVCRRIYSALFQLSGKPPTEWPEFGVPWRELSTLEIDWSKIDELEKGMKD